MKNNILAFGVGFALAYLWQRSRTAAAAPFVPSTQDGPILQPVQPIVPTQVQSGNVSTYNVTNQPGKPISQSTINNAI